MRLSIHRVLLTLLLPGLLFFSGCGPQPTAKKRDMPALETLNNPNWKIGVMTGIAATTLAKEKFPRADFREYPMPVDAFTALCSGKIDSVVIDRPTLEFMALAHPGLQVLKEDIGIGHISVAAAKRNPELMVLVNKFIRAYRADGTYAQMYDRWFQRKNPTMPVIPAPGPCGNVLKIGVTANNEPLCFVNNGKLAGFDVEFSLHLGAFLCRKVEFIDMPYDALVMGLESGKIDLAVAYMDAQPERLENVLFSENYIDSPIAVLTRRPNEGVKNGDEKWWNGGMRSLTESFSRTFIRENRWKLILRGWWITLFIAFFSVLLGTLLAFPLAMMCRSHRKTVAWLGTSYVSLMLGTPILVVLMILYYVIFSCVDISAICVAILAFGLDFAAVTSLTLRAGIDSVPRGQLEAALALGHRPSAAYIRFILPQAMRIVLPVYRGEVITTLKATSIVGYIAIMDLTKMGDIIRSRTYEAFFPLLAIALIYFLTAKGISAFLECLERRFDPEARRDLAQKRGMR